MPKAHYIIPIFVPHEGCPHNCVFCNQSSITGSEIKVDAKYVRETIEEYLTTLPAENCTKEVSFFGGTFTAISMEKQKELLDVAREYKANNKLQHIRLSTRPDYIDEYILDNLKIYNVDIIELGVQSLDEEVLFKSARGHNEDDVIKASKLIKDYGFTLGHQIMLGLPGDTFEKDILTTEKLINLKPDLIRIYPALVIKDTPMEKMYENNMYVPYTLDQAIQVTKIIYGRFISSDIKVIRVGLQATKEINDGKEIVAGPFHPAFGELVEGSILNDVIKENVPKDYCSNIIIRISPKYISKLFCGRKVFFNAMKSQLNTLDITILQDSTYSIGEIAVEMEKICLKLSIVDFLREKYKEGYLYKI